MGVFCSVRGRLAAHGWFGALRGLLTPRLNRKLPPERYLSRHILAIQAAARSETLGNASWLPGTERPADSLGKQKCNMAPFPPRMRDGSFSPGARRSLKGVATSATPQRARKKGGQ